MWLKYSNEISDNVILNLDYVTEMWLGEAPDGRPCIKYRYEKDPEYDSEGYVGHILAEFVMESDAEGVLEAVYKGLSKGINTLEIKDDDEFIYDEEEGEVY